MNKKYQLIIAVLAIALIAVSIALIFKISMVMPAKAPTVSPQNIGSITLQPANINVNAPVIDQSAGHDLVPTTINSFVPTINVKWLAKGVDTDEKTVSAEIGRKIPPPKMIDGEPTGTPTFVMVGSIVAATDEKLVGDKIYRVHAGCEVMGPGNCIDALAIADPRAKKFIIISAYPGPERGYDRKTSDIYPFTGISSFDDNLYIPDLQAPNMLQLATDGYSVATANLGTGTPSDENKPVIGLTQDGTRLYGDTSDYGRIWGRLPDGEYVEYSLTIGAFFQGRIPTITWNDGTQNYADYSYQVMSGCGGLLGMHIDDAKEFAGRLVLGGKTTNGENVYLLKDGNDKILTDLYAMWTPYETDSGKPSLESFVASRPVFFWYDPFGRLVEWQRVDVMPQAECGKPVVYLYPKKTQAVGVKLGSNIEVTKSEPTYANGWNVTASPDGTLTAADGKSYPYLYWDGNGASYETPTTGFVVASKDVEATLKEKLTMLGLNEKEIADFNAFWVPIVAKSPYARISFVPQAEWSRATPLAISPAPQTVIRVFMDWQPLSAPISIEPQILPPTPIRAGFTAVEWGGLLYK